MEVVLLISGAWHVPEHYQKLVTELEKKYIVDCPRLQTCNNAVPPTATLDDDVEQIRDIATKHLNSGKEVIAVMHSYGGMVGTNALPGLPIKALIYITAFVPLEGEALTDMFGGSLPPWLSPNQETGVIDISEPGAHFYNDLPVEEQEKWVKLLVAHPNVAQHKPPVKKIAPAYLKIPATYLYCRGDTGIPLWVQEMMVDRVQKATNVKFSSAYCDGDHSPFLTIPDRILEVVNEVSEREKSANV